MNHGFHIESDVSWAAYENDFWSDTEDWSNEAENSALHHRSKWHLKMENWYLKLIFHKKNEQVGAFEE